MRYYTFLLCGFLLFMISCSGPTPSFDPDPILGDADAEVTLVAYEDFQCGYCRRFNLEILPELDEEYISTGKVKIEFKDFPITKAHPQAQEAAEAAECAAEQDAFWPYHDILFERQGAFTVDNFKRWASELHLDSETFDACLEGGVMTKEVLADYDEGDDLQVTGTPTTFIADQRLNGVHLYSAYKAQLDYALGIPTETTADELNERWTLEGSEGLQIGGYGDNFAYDGDGVKPFDGAFTLDVNPKTERGSVVATMKNAQHQYGEDVLLEGTIQLVMTDFHEMAPYEEGGIADFIWLHGDTGNGPPVMPRVYSYLAGYGTLDIYVNKVLAFEDVHGHFMFTERARVDSQIKKSDGTVYDPKTMSGDSGFTIPTEAEFHIVAHSMDPDMDNFPAHSQWIHLNFQQVDVLHIPAGVALSVPVSE